MAVFNFEKKLERLEREYDELIYKKNIPAGNDNGVVSRYQNPVLTRSHVPLFWRYDLNQQSNPFLMERFGINGVFNAGAIKLNDKYLVIARVEGVDRKSFFAVAESDNGIDNFRFWDYPVVLPDIDEEETNIYDMRLTQHEDGWIYGTFCSEKRDSSVSKSNQSAAIASCGIVRTKDLKSWERFPNLKTKSLQQRNVVLHPEFINRNYALYTRPQDDFIEAGSGGGIGFALVDDIKNAVIDEETIVDEKKYHTNNEMKNGQGPAPIKTEEGWLHLAHGVRNTAAGLRYVLYAFITSIDEPSKIIYKPAGYLLAPIGAERVGDVSNVLFSNGWIYDENGNVFIYYASSDTRLHVATSTVEKLIDYCKNTAEDGYRSAKSVETLKDIINKNIVFKSISNKENGFVNGSSILVNNDKQHN